MSGSIIPTPAYKATDWQSFGTQVEKQRLGFIAISLTNYNNDSVPQIAAGSVVEISGSLFIFESNDSIGGTPTSDSLNYVMLEVSGSGDSQTVSGSWTTTAPTWNDGKQGYYDATENKRCVGGCYYDGTNYTDKWIYLKPQDHTTIRRNGSLRPLRNKVVPIGDWNMDSTSGKEISWASLDIDFEDVVGVQAIIRNDLDSDRRFLNAGVSELSANPQGVVYWDSGNGVILRRLMNGYFDSTSFDQTSYNRGWVVVTYED